MNELGYEPDMLAQSLRRRETLTVGFVVGDISNPLFAEIVMGVESTLHATGYSMLLTNSLGDPALEAAHIGPALAAAGRRPRHLGVDETHPETSTAARAGHPRRRPRPDDLRGIVGQPGALEPPAGHAARSSTCSTSGTGGSR